MLGGVLIERFGFQATFLITAAIKCAATLPLFALLHYVPDGTCLPTDVHAPRLARQLRWQRGKAAADEAGSSGSGSSDQLQEPLLVPPRPAIV